MNKDKILNIEHILLHAINCIIGAVVYSYASNFLLFKGYSNTSIGIIISVSGLISILLQPIVANIADRAKKLDVVQIMLIMMAICLFLCLPLYRIQTDSFALTLIFISIYCITDATQPLLNTVGFKMEEFGVKSDYGFARAFGSISFAIYCAIIGNIINLYSENSIAISGIIFYLLMCILLFFMNKSFASCRKVANIKKQESLISLREFIANNKKMLYLCISIALFMFGSNIDSYYLIQIITPLGGNTVHQGYLGLMWAMLEVPGMMLFSKLQKRFKIENLLIFSAIVYAIKSIGVYFSSNMLMIYLSLSLQWGSFALFQPAIVEYINTNTKKEESNRGQALKTTVCAIGTMITNFVGGFIIDYFGIKTLLLLGCVITVLGAYLFTILIKKN